MSATIPGARRHDQAAENVAAAELPPLDQKTMSAIREVYDDLIRPHVHHRW